MDGITFRLIKDGNTFLFEGFGLEVYLENLSWGYIERGLKELTIISIIVGFTIGIGDLLKNRQIKKAKGITGQAIVIDGGYIVQ
ncbi:hypothetical protein WAX74_10030 [Psychrobacillus sp. FJAT-51614]|uniref:Uncharacterized protein n=1 Tax=Psychrobacillus mangrovi TaxID=3117745 RepID=A0ABU8F4P7_9BACI